jgi:Uma2 family endonuclease
MVAGRAIVRVQSPIHLSEISEPQPDLALLRLRPDFYATAHPGSSDVLLVVEVADPSVGYDQEAKLPRYSQTSIAEAWVVNISEDHLEKLATPFQRKWLW